MGQNGNRTKVEDFTTTDKKLLSSAVKSGLHYALVKNTGSNLSVFALAFSQAELPNYTHRFVKGDWEKIPEPTILDKYGIK